MSIFQNVARASALVLMSLTTAASANTLWLSGPADVTEGDSFQLFIEGDFSANGLLGGGSTFGFDPALVSVDNIALIASADPGFSCPGAVGCPSTASSVGVWWANFSNVLQPGHAVPAQMAVIDLTALAVGTAVFTLADDPAAGGWFDTISGDATPVFTGTSVSISAIPVPAAVWLFGSGLLGLVGVARRKQAA